MNLCFSSFPYSFCLKGFHMKKKKYIMGEIHFLSAKIFSPHIREFHLFQTYPVVGKEFSGAS